MTAAQLRIVEALEECREYFNDRADAELDVTGYTGNEEMRLLVMVEEGLALARKIDLAPKSSGVAA
jgi:hypothetical protein